MRNGIAAWLALVSSLGAGCTDANDPRVYLWTVEQAESITSVRGQPVRVRHCRGIGRGERGEHPARYRRFRCLAGARAEFDRYDTVAALKVHQPLGDYENSTSRHRLTNVRFVGGPGIP
jgi:hypothetical protein